MNLKPKSQYEAEGDVFGEVRTMKTGLRVRLTYQESDWEKSTVLQIHIIGRPNKSSIIVFSHTGLPNVRLREQLRGQWTERLNEFKLALDEGHKPTSASKA